MPPSYLFPLPNLETDYQLAFNEDWSAGLSIVAGGVYDPTDGSFISAVPTPEARWKSHQVGYDDFGEAPFADPDQYSGDGEGNAFPHHVRTSDSGEPVLRTTLTTNAVGASGAWKGGLLSSVDGYRNGYTAKYGYWECKAKMPYGEGIWPAFWLVTAPKIDEAFYGMPDGKIEIDGPEYYGQGDTTDGFEFKWVIHKWLPEPHVELQNVSTFVPFSPHTDYHTYGILVTPDLIVGYIDRQPIAQFPTPSEHTDSPSELAIMYDLALGGGYPTEDTPDPSYIDCAYIKVWTPKFVDQPTFTP